MHGESESRRPLQQWILSTVLAPPLDKTGRDTRDWGVCMYLSAIATSYGDHPPGKGKERPAFLRDEAAGEMHGRSHLLLHLQVPMVRASKYIA